MNVKAIEMLEAHSMFMKSSIRDAFEALDGRFGMVITIVDEDNIFRGIVSDGDLRKALLNGHPLDEPLESVMNNTPVIIHSKELEEKKDFSFLISQLEEHGLKMGTLVKVMAIPVVDDQGYVLGLLTTEMLHMFNDSNDASAELNTKRIAPHVLVVGGAGYIGSILTEMLLKKGWRVRVLDKLIYDHDSLSGFVNVDKFSFVHGDVCDLHTQVDVIKGIDSVVFLAEIVGDPSCKYIPQTALKTNYLAINSMAALCAHTNINRFVYTSSCSVYGASSNPKAILNERSKLNPVSHYARMKILSEQALFNQLNELFSPTILRLATVFGHSYRPRFDLVANTFAKNAHFDGNLSVYGGDQWRPNVHVKDVARFIIKVLESPLVKVKKEVFNVGSNAENHTVKTLAELTTQVFPRCQVHYDDAEVDNRNYRVDFSKARKVLGFEAKITVLEGLKELQQVFESAMITDANDKKYSNIELLKEKNIYA